MLGSVLELVHTNSLQIRNPLSYVRHSLTVKAVLILTELLYIAPIRL